MNRILVVLLLAAGCKAGGKSEQKKAATDAPVKVEAVEVAARPMPQYLTLSGTLIADRESTVAAGTQGKVMRVTIERGSYVREGQLLAQVDARTASAAAAEARAHAEVQRAQKELAKSECERNEQMFQKGAASKAEYDRVHAQCATAQFTEQAAEARKSSTAAMLNDTEIKAPFAGVVAEKFINAGEFVRPDSRVATLLAIDTLRLEITVPESSSRAIKAGMDVVFHENDSEEEYKGKIRYVGPAIRRSSRDLIVEAIFDNKERKHRPGTFVVANLNLGDKPMPVVPKAALKTDGVNSRLYAIVNGRLEERVVQAGGEREGLVAIVNGVNAGEKIAAKATPELHDGAKVN